MSWWQISAVVILGLVALVVILYGADFIVGECFGWRDRALMFLLLTLLVCLPVGLIGAILTFDGVWVAVAVGGPLCSMLWFAHELDRTSGGSFDNGGHGC